MCDRTMFAAMWRLPPTNHVSNNKRCVQKAKPKILHVVNDDNNNLSHTWNLFYFFFTIIFKRVIYTLCLWEFLWLVLTSTFETFNDYLCTFIYKIIWKWELFLFALETTLWNNLQIEKFQYLSFVCYWIRVSRQWLVNKTSLISHLLGKVFFKNIEIL